MTAESLNESESKRLAYCEGVIREKLNGFMDVGAALATIREGKLYRAEFETFAAYCETKWEMTDRRARQYMAAFEAMLDLGKSGNIFPVPKDEAQVRELLKVEPEKRIEIFKEASEKFSTPQPTAKQIREVIKPAAPVRFDFGKHLATLAKEVEAMCAAAEDNLDLESLAFDLETHAAAVREIIEQKKVA